MSLEELELNVGGTSFKGVWIAVILSFSSTLGGGIWAASEFFSRLEGLEETVDTSLKNSEMVNQRFEDFRETWVEEKKTMVSDIAVAQQQIEDAGIDELQGKLATLSTNLQQILERQQELLAIQDRIAAAEATVTEMQVTVQKAETVTANTEQFKKKIDTLEKEVEDLWEGLDYLSNPYGG